MTQKTEEKIRQLQLAEQSMQQLMAQKQNLQVQLLEIETALKSLDDTSESYKIIGNVMILTDKPKLQNELKEKKETVELRINALDKQEKSTRDKAALVQKEVIEAMNNDKKNG